ncbi:MAG: hypothetical protein A3J40_05950 [Erythrobacter sp. RIFCSPHIGHO2_12_FULL_63_10]|nr:MAG: hypothetical protein A3J40_05950 [Erythrobacter sp. RIFCSPHIGHO2_12_FULL_63_10]
MRRQGPSSIPRVVVIGAGFGGLTAVRALRHADVEVTLIDKRNHHLFQPLLYQVATAALSPADIAAPIRTVLRNQRNVRVILDEAVGIDRHERAVRLASGREVGYDWLIVASGATHSYFGRDHWAQHAPGIKSIEDATAVRRKVLLALELAETEEDRQRREALLTFVVIGGGPTGVEMAGAITELAHRSVSSEFRSITPNCSKVILLNLAPRLLEGFPQELSEAACRDLTRMGVDVRNSTAVEDLGQDWVIAGGKHISAHTLIWAAGVKASDAARWLGCSGDGSGRVFVDKFLHPDGDQRVFVVGDTAHCTGPDRKPLPGIAPVAKQQGRYAALSIAARVKGSTVRPFRYRHYGNLATIGRSHAVVDFGWLQLRGIVAWLIWSTVHVYFLTNFRNRLIVGVNLAWNYLTFARHARLITGEAAPIVASVRTEFPASKGENHVRAK